MIEIKILTKYGKTHMLVLLAALIICLLLGLGNHFNIYNQDVAAISISITILISAGIASLIRGYKKSGMIVIDDNSIVILDLNKNPLSTFSFDDITRFRLLLTGVKGTINWHQFQVGYLMSTHNGISRIEIIDRELISHEYLVSISSDHTLNLFYSVFKDLDKKHPGKMELLKESRFNGS